MKIDADFFRDEVRNGFYIPAPIKQAWAANLEVLAEIDRICIKYNIEYFADWGTLLGAVRHGGFVPWDDDLDIGMKRAEYVKFRAVADKELPDNYVIHDYERKDNYWEFLVKVVNNDKICFDENYLRNHNNFPWLAGVDIFIKDNLYSCTEDEEARDKEIIRLYATAQLLIEGEYNRNSISEELDKINHKYDKNLSIDSDDKLLAVDLYKLIEEQMSRVGENEGDYIGQIFPWVIKNGIAAREEKELYKKYVRLPFENTTIPAPVCYNRVLSKRYGNYNEIQKVWTGHNYPFFEGQKKEIENIMKTPFPGFYFTKDMLVKAEKDLTGSIKNTASECLRTIENLLNSAKNEAQAENYEEAKWILTEAQQLGIEFGTLLEKQKGKDNPHIKNVVNVLEELCECIWRDAQNLLVVSKDKIGLSFEVFSRVKIAVKKNIENVKEVLFLTVGPEEWGGFRDVYKTWEKKSDVDIFIVPLPLLKKDYFGRILMSEQEVSEAVKINMYDKELRLMDWKEYDISIHCPDIVYVQNPYDEFNPCITVPRNFYTKEIRKYTGKIIYIPFKNTGEFIDEDKNDICNMKYYVNTPGVVYADKVMVQSENIRRKYIKCLETFSGGVGKKCWEEKVSVIQKKQIPDVKRCNEKKKIIFGIGLNELAEHADSVVESVKKRINIFAEANNSVEMFIYLYPNDIEIWKTFDSGLFDRIYAIIKKAGVKIIISPPRESDKISCEYDAYYGNPSPLVPAFIAQKKPVMIADYDV